MLHYPPRCPFRAWLLLPDDERIELVAVRGMDGAPQYGCPPDRQMWHLFGPAGVALPDVVRPLIDPPAPCAYLRFELLVDAAGITRFAAPFPMPQTPQ